MYQSVRLQLIVIVTKCLFFIVTKYKFSKTKKALSKFIYIYCNHPSDIVEVIILIK